jgi:tRNA(Ile)-lysidine synthetase-like protein
MAAHRRGFFAGWSAFARSWAGLDSAALARVAAGLAERQVVLVPTLVLHETLSRLGDPALYDDPALRDVPGSEWFDADRVGSSVILRHWRPGDRFQPSGLAAPAKLQDLFVNARIPRARRQRLTVATTRGGEIWWVEGLRIGERFKLCPETTRRLWWSWERPGTESSAGQSGPDSATGRR